jgi:hypothetical protein
MRVDVSVFGQTGPARVGVDLDPVGAVGDLLADRLAAAVRAVADLDAGREAPVGTEAQDRIRAGRRERGARDLEPRARDDALVHRVAQRDVAVTHALGLEVAQRREAVLERDLQGSHRAGDPVRRVLLQNLVVVLPIGRVALDEDVRMGVDQARQQGPAAEVDDARAGRDRGRVGRHALDPASRDDDDGMLRVAPARDIEEPRRAQDDRLRILLCADDGRDEGEGRGRDEPAPRLTGGQRPALPS